MVTTGLTALEALGVAVRREMDAARTYADLGSGCTNPLARERFHLLECESQQHEAMLRRRYRELELKPNSRRGRAESTVLYCRIYSCGNGYRLNPEAI